MDRGLISQKGRGLSAIIVRIFLALNYFQQEFGGLGPPSVDWAAQLGSLVDRGGADKRAWWHLAGAWRMGARAPRCSLAAVEGGEPDEAMP
jgi:hypothetical protein